MITVTAITSGRNVPSRRFRVEQFIQPMRQFGVNISEYCLFKSKYEWPQKPASRTTDAIMKILGRIPAIISGRSSDITWLEREFLPGYYTLEKFAGRNCIFDVDDAIWLTGKSNFSERIVSKCRGLIAGNDFIADHYRRFTNRIWVVPTSIDTERWMPIRRPKHKWVIGWSGTSSNLRYLHAIEKPLGDFLREHHDCELLVQCDHKPVFNDIRTCDWRFVPWSASTEVEVIQSMDVGLAPLIDTDWARGKCSLKMLMYMAVGIPVVASPFGQNQQLLSTAEFGLAATTSFDWYSALNSLFADESYAGRLGSAGRVIVKDKYSVQANVYYLNEIFLHILQN